MALAYNENQIDLCWAQWVKMGFEGAGMPYAGDVDPEKLLIETTHICRWDGRICKAFRTWVRDYGDLINLHRLREMLRNADTAVLGITIDLAVEGGANTNLRTLLRECMPKSQKEAFFPNQPGETGFFEERQKEFASRDYLKWGFYGYERDFYEDAMRPRPYVLRTNPRLLFRSIFGTNLRAEIIFALYSGLRTHAKGLCDHLGYSYHPMHQEVEVLVSNGWLTFERNGRAKVLSLNPKFKKHLFSLAV